MLSAIKQSLWAAQLFVAATKELSVAGAKQRLRNFGLVQARDFPPVIGKQSVVTLWGASQIAWRREPLCCKTLVSGVLARRPGTVLELFSTHGKFGAHAAATGAKVAVVAINPKPELEDRLKEAALALPRSNPP